MIFIQSYRQLELGKVINSNREECIIKDGNEHFIPFLVIREATVKEWIQDWPESKIIPNSYYYQVSID